MKLYLVALFLFLAGAARADPVSLVFERAMLPDLARVVYTELAREPFILSSEFLADQQIFSLNLRGIERDNAVLQFVDLLKASGYTVESRAGVSWIGKTKPEEDHELVYRPKHRPVNYLLDLLTSLFKPGFFSQQRAQSSGQSAQPVQVAQVQAQGKTQGKTETSKSPPIDTGTSAFSAQDKISDVLLARGSAKDLQRAQGLLEQLDTATPELLVKAVVYEVTTENGDKSALSLAANILKGRAGFNAGKVIAGDYSAFVGIGGIAAVFDALSSDRRFKVVSAPTLRVRSGSTARLTVGSETPVLGQAQLDKNGNPIQSIDYRPAGVILDLKPQVREDVAELAISQQISNFILTTTGVNSSPTLIKRELSTSVGIKPDEILILGGLDENKATDETSGVSFLPAWLRSTSASRSRTEVLLILQAQRI